MVFTRRLFMQVVESFDLRRRVITLDQAFCDFLEDESMDAEELVDWLQVSSPCNRSWLLMEGDETKRFCGGCEKYVYNVAALSRTEVIALMQSDDERKVCKRVDNGSTVRYSQVIALSAEEG
jgi:hypothetical protein